MVCQFSAILYDMGQVWNTKVWTRGSVFTNLQLLSPCVQAPAWQQPIQAPTFSRVIKNKSWWFNYCHPTFQPLDWSLTIEEHIVSPCFTFVNQEGQWQRFSIFHDSMCTWRHRHPPWENMDSVRTLSDQESFGEAALWPSSRVVRCFNHRFAPWIRQQRVDRPMKMRQWRALQSLINSLSTNAVRNTSANRICSRILRHRHSHGDFTTRIMTSGSPSMSVDQFHKLTHLSQLWQQPPQQEEEQHQQLLAKYTNPKQFHDRARLKKYHVCYMWYVSYIHLYTV